MKNSAVREIVTMLNVCGFILMREMVYARRFLYSNVSMLCFQRWKVDCHCHVRSPILGCYRFTKLCWVEKHANIIMTHVMKPTKSQHKANPTREKIGGILAIFSHSKYFFVSWD